MLEVLTFVFSSFSTWLGTFLLLLPICFAISNFRLVTVRKN
jgi:hypothetical protein